MYKSNQKIAIIADIHANYPCFSKVMEDISKKNIKTILFLGDYITDGFENNKILDIIKQYKYVISGNRERSIANYDGYSWEGLKQYANMLYTYKNLSCENMEYIKTLPSYSIISLNNKKICLSHGTPFYNREMVYSNSFDIFDKLIQFSDCNVYLFAHSHEAFCTSYKDRLFINPGSVILPADNPTSKYGILDLETMQYEAVLLNYNFEFLRNYYMSTDYFTENKEWCNILIHTNESGIDYICKFIDFVKSKAKQKNINISNGIPNKLWDNSFKSFMDENRLQIY